MLVWFAETSLVALVLAVIATLAGRSRRLGAGARHVLWLVVLLKLVTPPVLNWPRPVRPAQSPVVESSLASPPIVSASRSEVWPSYLPPIDDQPRPEMAPARPRLDRKASLNLPEMGPVALRAWACVSAALTLLQVIRIVRFRNRLRWAVPAPEWIVDEARAVAGRLNVRAPEVLVVTKLGSPIVWFLGRPRLLLPARLVKSLGVVGWRSILAHELAHLRRGDHWVRRLELAAGLLWWWNPLYWITCRRLDAEAELACDATANDVFPEGRLAFAEALLEICQSLCSVRPPSPALGVAGSGRFLQRRVTMILRDHSVSRASAPVILFAILLVLLALPGWSASASTGINLAGAHAALQPTMSAVALFSDDEDDMDDVDDEDEADAPKPSKGAKTDKAKQKEAKKSEKKEGARLPDMKQLEKLTEALEKQLGPGSEFEKQMEELGPMLEKALEPLGKELEAKFGPGSDFEKSINAKFGPGSDFQKSIEAKFGPGSEFEKSITEKFGPGSEFEKSLKQSGSERKATEGRKKSVGSETEAKPSINKKKATKVAKEEKRSKARRIKDLQAQIEKLSEELEAMKAQGIEEDEDE